MQERHTALQIKIINDRLEKEANNILREKGLTSVQMHVLMLLLDAEDRTVPLKEVERELHVAQPTAAGIVVRLEQKGFLESRLSEEDRRVKLLRLTEAGRKQCRECLSRAREAEIRVRAALTEDEYGELSGLLEKIILSLGISARRQRCGKQKQEPACGRKEGQDAEDTVKADR